MTQVVLKTRAYHCANHAVGERFDDDCLACRVLAAFALRQVSKKDFRTAAEYLRSIGQIVRTRH